MFIATMFLIEKFQIIIKIILCYMYWVQLHPLTFEKKIVTT